MSEYLKSFFEAWIEWVDTGAVENFVFSRRLGLCSALYRYHTRVTVATIDALRKAESDLYSLFNGEIYPFNINSQDFEQETDHSQMHTNPRRLAFVRSQIEKANQTAK